MIVTGLAGKAGCDRGGGAASTSREAAASRRRRFRANIIFPWLDKGLVSAGGAQAGQQDPEVLLDHLARRQAAVGRMPAIELVERGQQQTAGHRRIDLAELARGHAV